LLIVDYLQLLQGSTRRISYRHIQEIEDLIFNRPVNAIVDLPKGISVLKKTKYILFFLGWVVLISQSHHLHNQILA